MTETSHAVSPATNKEGTPIASGESRRMSAFHGMFARLLRYGENARQKYAALFEWSTADRDPYALSKFVQIEGADPSYVNMTDLDRALETMSRIAAAWMLNFGHVPLIAIVVKHGNACGGAVGEDFRDVIERMIRGDPQAAFGGFVITNFIITGNTARVMREYLMADGEKRLFDGVIAPCFEPEAVEELARKKTGKCRLFENRALADIGCRDETIDSTVEIRHVRGGHLEQDGDPYVFHMPSTWYDSLTRPEREDMVLGWGLGCKMNSNTVALVKNGMLIGAGIARSRVMAAKIALLYATTYGHDPRGAIAYSDSFFSESDGPIVLAEAGITAVFATSGSKKDVEVELICAAVELILLTLPDAEARGFSEH